MNAPIKIYFIKSPHFQFQPFKSSFANVFSALISHIIFNMTTSTKHQKILSFAFIRFSFKQRPIIGFTFFQASNIFTFIRPSKSNSQPSMDSVIPYIFFKQSLPITRIRTIITSFSTSSYTAFKKFIANFTISFNYHKLLIQNWLHLDGIASLEMSRLIT